MDYYEYKLCKLKNKINKIKLIEPKSSGTAFVTFESQDAYREAELKLSQCKNIDFWNKKLDVK